MDLKFCESITEKFDGRADVKEIVAFILRKNVFRCCNQQLYFYYRDYRYYIPIEKQNEWHVVSCFISDATQEKISHSKSDEIINKIKDNFKIQMTFNDFNRDIYCINLLNGVYDVAERKLYDEYEDECFNYFLNVNYISPDKRRMPNFEHFCKTSLGGDEAKKEFLLQMIGYCCTILMMAKKCFILLGPPNCGKSLILHLIEYMIGEDYISSIQLENLGNRFSTAVLSGKRLNICGELSARPLKNIEIFKLVVGGDTLSGEFKGKDVFQFKNKCKLIYAGNILPPIKNEDISTAFVDRIALLIFPDSIKQEERIPDMMERLKGEVDSIFSEAIDKVDILIKNNYIFPKMEDADMMLADYSFQQTHIDNFIDECCIIKPEYRIHTVALYERYIEFCSANGVNSISQNLFSQKISSVKGVENKRFRSGNGESRRGFIGISVKSRGHQDSEM